MPSQPDLKKVRVRVSGQPVDPAIYAKVGGLAVRLDPDVTQPVSGGLALSAAPVNGFSTCAAFCNSVGANVHFLFPGVYGGTGGGSGTMLAAAQQILDRVAELGIRHIRDGAYASWFDFRSVGLRLRWIAVRNRNRNLPSPSATDAGQPILFSMIAPGYGPTLMNRVLSGGLRGCQAYFSLGQPVTVPSWYDAHEGPHQHYNGDTGAYARGVPGALEGTGAPIPNGTSTPNADAAQPNPWNFNDVEFPWEVIGAILGPNEPGVRQAQIQHTDPAWKDLTTWQRAMTTEKNNRGSMAAMGSYPVVTVDGLVNGPVTVKQIPVIGTQLSDGGLPDTHDLDWSLGTGVVDCGDGHPYPMCGLEPSTEYVSRVLFNTPMARPYTGAMRTPPDTTKGVPFCATEWGHISFGSDSARSALSAGFHSAYWPTPDDIIAEYVVRTLLLFYLRGVRRNYVYEFADQGTTDTAENRFGWLTAGRARKQQFYAVKNLMRIIGWTEPSAGAKAALSPLSVSGFTAVGTDGSGLNKQIAMFSGIGDNGQVAAGGVWHSNADRLHQLLLQQNDTTYLYCVWRNISLWQRERGNWDASATGTARVKSLFNEAAGRFTPDTQTLTLNLPSGVSALSVCQPTSGIATQQPTDASPPGQTFTPVAFPGNQASFTMQGHTKVFKIVKP